MAGLDLQTAKELKFIREQTTHCAGDLGSLRRELQFLKSQQEELGRELASVAGTVWEREKRLELSSYGREQGSTKEIKACQSKVVGLEKELEGQKACQSKVAGLEKELQGQGNQLDVLKQLVRDIGPDMQPNVRELRAVLKYDLTQDVDRKLSLQKIAVDRDREASCAMLESRVESLTEKVNQAQLALEASRRAAQVALDERLSRLETEIVGQVGREMEALNKVSREMAACNSEVQRLKDALGYSALLSLSPHEPLAAVAGSALGLSPGLRTQAPSICERLEQLERSTTETAKKHSQDWEASRMEVRSLESTHQLHLAQQSSAAAQLTNLEKICQEIADKHSRDVEANRVRFEQMHGTILQQQSQLTLLDEVNRRVGSLAASESRLSAELTAASARVEQQLVRLATLEGQSRQVTELREAVASGREERLAAEAQHGVRVERLEERLGELTGKHAADSDAVKKEFEAAIAACSSTALQRAEALEKRLAGSIQGHKEEAASACSRLEERVAAQEAQKPIVTDLQVSQAATSKEAAELRAQQASLAERLSSLEGSVVGAASRSSADTEALRAAHSAHANDLQAAKAELARCAALHERLADVERRHGDLHSRHGEEHQEARSRLEQLGARLAASEVHALAVEDLRRAHASSLQEQAALQSQHAASHERLQRLEGLLAGHAEQHAARAEAMADAHAKSHRELRDKHAEELGAALARLEQVHARLVTCEQHGPAVADLKQAVAAFRDDRAARDVHQHKVLERVDRLEGILSDVQSRHAAEAEALKACHASSAKELEAATIARHAAVAERVDGLEKSLGGSLDRSRQDLASAGAKLEQLQGRLSQCEAQQLALADLKAAHAAAGKEVTGLRSKQVELADKLELLEGKVTSAANKSTASAESLRRTGAEHAQELEVLRSGLAQQAVVAERLDRAEKSLASLAGRQSEEGTAASAKLEHLSSRLSAAEARCASLDELRLAHDGTAQETAKLRTLHSSLRDRIEAVGGLAEWHARQLEAVKDAHAESTKQHAGVHADFRRATDERIASCEQHGALIASLQKDIASLRSERPAHEERQQAFLERLGHFETQLGDGLARQSAATENLKAAHARHAQEVEALVLSRHATSADRLDSFERVLGNAIEGHRKDLAANGTRLEQLHGRLAACEVFKGQHSMLLERLDGLEGQLGEARGLYCAEVEVAREAQSRQARELEALRAASAQQAGTVQRLHGLERTLDGVSSRQADALSKLDDVGGRLSACEQRGSSLCEELRRGQLASQGQLQGLQKDVEELKTRQADLGKLRGVLSNVRKAWDQESLPAGAPASGAVGHDCGRAE